MPVFSVPPTVVSEDRRRSLLDKLRKERQQPSPSGEPMIFEIPVEEPDRIDVLVVWQEWGGVPPVERENVILDAYGDLREKLVQAVGVTYEEAMQQQLLPYSIVSALDRPKLLGLMRPAPEEQQKYREEIRNAMLQEGNARQRNNKVELRFPTNEMAEQAMYRLIERFRDGYWSVAHSASFAADNL
jgi:hypothetical protein